MSQHCKCNLFMGVNPKLSSDLRSPRTHLHSVAAVGDWPIASNRRPTYARIGPNSNSGDTIVAKLSLANRSREGVHTSDYVYDALGKNILETLFSDETDRTPCNRVDNPLSW